MIFPGSRYQNATIGLFKWPDEPKRVVPISPRRVSINDLGQDYLMYEVNYGDELDSLAERFGGNFEEYWKIADINNIKYPLDPIASGTTLFIPSKDAFNNSESANLVVFE